MGSSGWGKLEWDVPKHRRSDVAHYKLASQFSLSLKRLSGLSALFLEIERNKEKRREEKKGSHSLSILVRTKHYLSSFWNAVFWSKVGDYITITSSSSSTTPSVSQVTSFFTHFLYSSFRVFLIFEFSRLGFLIFLGFSWFLNFQDWGLWFFWGLYYFKFIYIYLGSFLGSTSFFNSMPLFALFACIWIVWFLLLNNSGFN